MRDKNILSSEMLHKDYDRKGSVAKKKKLVVVLKGLGAKMRSLRPPHISSSVT
jgi:hypothetical protein